MNYLGLDILMEILSRLGVKDLIRLKSVSKTFLDLISSDDFIRLHLNKSSSRVIHPSRRISLYVGAKEETDMIKTISYGSCNGLVCLMPKQKNSKYGGGVLLWNPALHEAVYVPIKKPEMSSYSRWLCWFGYDDDVYKLIIGTASHIHIIRLFIDTDSWKSSVEIDRNYEHCEVMGSLVHGSVHWPAYHREDCKHTIISYDLRNERFGRISTPDGMIKSYPFVVEQVDGCLSTTFQKEFHMEQWVMKEYGVEESWTKLMIIPLKMLPTNPCDAQFDDLVQLNYPIYSEDFYVESLISPISIKPRCAD